ncbi:hypothetical protein HTT03_13440 [Sulfitobacter sp. S0837]|uniref:hypothetical protein n=1 Tax=Sulfitobacter maritimus TaxID=2741719 RepID=UPI001581B3C8|nr:hypothetical protein [Sulfitobacter maritimus]NUH66292.1 hypothetical protein [Sulfitobacter maritimus]
MQDWAIFTGDIVKSSAMTRAGLNAVFDRLQDAAEAIAQWQDAPAYLTRFRGDGWQLAVRPGLTFRAALTLRAAVRRGDKTADTRIAIGIGQAHLAGSTLADADGDALVASGHALDTMPRNRRFSAPAAPLALRCALPLADRLATGWTQRQAEVTYYMLAPDRPVQTALAERLALTQQSVQGHVEAAGVDEVLEICEMLEST